MKAIYVPLILGFSLTLGGCSWLEGYRPPIQQGNVISKQSLDTLKTGMSKQQVAFMLGDPLLQDPFDSNRWDYVYYLKPSFGAPILKRATLYFKADKLIRITEAGKRSS